MDMSKMKFIGKLQDDGEYADYTLASNLCQNVIVSYHYASKKWEGNEQTSVDDTAGFDSDRDMTEDEVAECIKLIPLKWLPLDESPS